MYIEKINIGSFGALTNCELSLAPGMNIIEGRNESGKTTVASFIKFILYGMKGIDGADRHMSWNGAAASGSLTVSADGRRILIERRAAYAGARGAVRETVRMTDLGTGLEVYAGKCPGEALLGVPEDVFAGTAYVRQIGGAEIDGAKMSAAAENLLFSADEAVNTEKAAERIDLLRRQLLYKNGKGGAIYEKTAKIEELTRELESAKRASTDLINIDAQLADYEKKRATSEERCADVRRRIELCRSAQKLEMIDKMKSLRSEATSVENERRELLASDADFGGSLPDASLINEITSAADAMTATSSSIADASRKLDGLRSEEAAYRDTDVYGDLTTEDGVEDAAEKIESYSTRRSVLSVLAVVMLVVAGACAASAFSFASGVLRLILLIAACVSSAAALAFVVSAIVSGMKYSRRLHKYGASGKDDLRECLRDAAEDVRARAAVREEISAAETELYVQYSVYDDEKKTARELLARLGITDTDDDGLVSELRRKSAAAASLAAREGALRARITSLKKAADELESKLSGESEDKLREAVGSETPATDDASVSRLRSESDLANAAHSRIVEAIHKLEITRTQLAATRSDPAATAVKLDMLSRELEEDKARYEACVLAAEALTRAGQGVRESVAPRLREAAREYLGRISDGKYTELGVDAKFGVTVSADGAYRDLSLLSGGTVDAAYLALRLALVKLLFRRETTPLIFDESFSRLDDARTRALLSLIAAPDGQQSLILTCQKREGLIAASVTEARKITLSV